MTEVQESAYQKFLVYSRLYPSEGSSNDIGSKFEVGDFRDEEEAKLDWSEANPVQLSVFAVQPDPCIWEFVSPPADNSLYVWFGLQ